MTEASGFLLLTFVHLITGSQSDTVSYKISGERDLNIIVKSVHEGLMPLGEEKVIAIFRNPHISLT